MTSGSALDQAQSGLGSRFARRLRETLERIEAMPELYGTVHVGEVRYDLNLDGVVSDLTARFRIVITPGGLMVRFHDIGVM